MKPLSRIYTSVPYTPGALSLLRHGWALPPDIPMPTAQGDKNPAPNLEEVKAALKIVEDKMATVSDDEARLLHNIAWLPLIEMRQKLGKQAFSEMPRTLVPYNEAVTIIEQILYAAIKKRTSADHVRVNDIHGYRDEVALVAACLADAEGQLHDTHGVSRILTYVPSILNGEINPRGKVTLVQKLPGKLSFDGGGTFGQVAVQMALQGALEHMNDLPEGSALVVSMRNASHAGRLEWILRQAVRNGYHCFAFFNVDGTGRTPPVGGTESRLGTNPIAGGVSTGIGDNGMVGDLATTPWAEGKVRVAYLNNLPVQLGVLTTSAGDPVIDPAGVYREDGLPDLLLSLGGDVASYKGSTLSVMIKLFVDAVSGRSPGDPIGKPGHNNLVLILSKGDQNSFNTTKDGITYLGSCPTADGGTVRLPGVTGLKNLADAKEKEHGLHIATGTWDKVLALHRDQCN